MVQAMSRAEALAEISRIAGNPLASVRRWKEETGGKVLGCLSCMPFFCPEELVYAAGIHPVGIWGAETPISLADAKLQSFACSMARTALEMALRGWLDVCDGFMFPSTCDAFQNLAEVWKGCLEVPCFEVVFPRQTSRTSAAAFLRSRLEKLKAELESFTGVAIDGESIRKACALYNENRRLLRELNRLRSLDPAFLSGRQMAEIVLAVSFAPRQACAEWLRALLRTGPGERQGRSFPAGQRNGRLRIFLGGVMPRPLSILNFLEERGAWVVGDDMGLGSLFYSIDLPEEDGSLDGLARAYLRQPACSTIHDPTLERAGALLSRVRETGARAVILFIQKFCEPELFDLPALRGRLEREGVPVLALETELCSSETGPLRNRIEAFLETLKDQPATGESEHVHGRRDRP